MSSPKPTLGYPSRTAAIMAFRQEGLTTREISARIGIPVTTVSALECSSRREPAGTGGREVSKSIMFPLHLLQALGPAARRRGMSREELAWLIVDKVAEDNLIDAVLDDAEELAS